MNKMRYIKSPGDIITHICYNNNVMYMKLINETLIEIKKSKFIGLYYEVDSIDEAKNNMKSTAGLPIYNIIERKQLNNCLVVVVRYFGGIKLGAGGLLRAYTEAANQATNKK